MKFFVRHFASTTRSVRVDFNSIIILIPYLRNEVLQIQRHFPQLHTAHNIESESDSDHVLLASLLRYGHMDIRFSPAGKFLNPILVIGFSVAAILLGTGFSAAALENLIGGFFSTKKINRVTHPVERSTRKRKAIWDGGRYTDMLDIPTAPCERSLTVQDIACSFHCALFNTSNNVLAHKAFKSLPLILIYNGRRSAYITNMRVILINYFMNLFDRSIFNVSLCVEACRAIQMLSVIQSGPLAHNYNVMLSDAGAIETVTDALQIHMPTGSDCFLNVTLVTRGIRYLDENIKRYIFDFLYSSLENAVVAELSCSVLGRLCNNTDITRDYTGVLNSIILALAAHVTNDVVAIPAFTTIFNCRLVKLSLDICEKSSNSLHNSIITALVLYESDPRIVIMCCHIVTELCDRKLKVNNTEMGEAIAGALRSQIGTSNIRGGAFDTLCQAALIISKNNERMTVKIKSLKIHEIIGQCGDSLSLLLSPTRAMELYLLQKKFTTYPFN